jgi:16S rRNA (uracil1498-N3)-methyltransferase
MPRFFVDLPLARDLETGLPAAAARHVQVLRLQPGDAITLFDGRGADWPAQVLRIGRSEVVVRVGEPRPVDRELPVAVTLAVGVPANERMDWLVEKATELGAAAIQPLACERSVLRVSGERAERRLAHWQGVAAAAAEQCGRSRLPRLEAMRPFTAWCRTLDASAAETAPEVRRPPGAGFVLSVAEGAPPFAAAVAAPLRAGAPLLFLSGPEGGLSVDEEAQARDAGLRPVTLGPRVLRAETAPLAALAMLSALHG